MTHSKNFNFYCLWLDAMWYGQKGGGGGKEDRNQYGIQKAGECMDILNERRKWRSWNINHRAREGECLKILTQKKILPLY